MMKGITASAILLIIIALHLPGIDGFAATRGVTSQPPYRTPHGDTRLHSKKSPKGDPVTVQENEDAAMWIEDKKGNVKKALKNPVGGRPIDKVTKDQLQGGAAEKKKKKKPWWMP